MMIGEVLDLPRMAKNIGLSVAFNASLIGGNLVSGLVPSS
jgi:hypothetical protein